MTVKAETAPGRVKLTKGSTGDLPNILLHLKQTRETNKRENAKKAFFAEIVRSTKDALNETQEVWWI